MKLGRLLEVAAELTIFNIEVNLYSRDESMPYVITIHPYHPDEWYDEAMVWIVICDKEDSNRWDPVYGDEECPAGDDEVLTTSTIAGERDAIEALGIGFDSEDWYIDKFAWEHINKDADKLMGLVEEARQAMN